MGLQTPDRFEITAMCKFSSNIVKQYGTELTEASFYWKRR